MARRRDEVVWRPGMPEAETQLRIEVARWRHGGREGARSRLGVEVLEGVRTPESADAALAELDAEAERREARLAEMGSPSQRRRARR